ncbi:MAG: serine protein kinase RIO [Candidatus Baldrarchaeia archaeon]
MGREHEIIKRLERELEKYRVRLRGIEDFKIRDSVFDRRTLMALFKVLKLGIVDSFYGVVSTGKEAHVYWAKDPQGRDLAVKIYRTATSEFKKSMWMYIDGDPRFAHVKKLMWPLIVEWAKKEFKNLQRACEAEVLVPRPIKVVKNVLVMEFIGEEGIPAPQIRQVTLEDPDSVFNTVLEFVKRLYQRAHLVHGDLSEYNILYWNDQPYFIDMAQSVLIKHPMAHHFLLRDLKNILRFFSSRGVEVPTLEGAFTYVTGHEPEELI